LFVNHRFSFDPNPSPVEADLVAIGGGAPPDTVEALGLLRGDLPSLELACAGDITDSNEFDDPTDGCRGEFFGEGGTVALLKGEKFSLTAN